jgi:large subunit ribosomal protein L1
MPRQGKRYRADLKEAPDSPLPLSEAIEKVRTFRDVKFDQTIDIAVHLGIDPRKADQALRGSISLPHGIGRSKRVIAFCPADKVEACKAAGDVAVATPDMMRLVSRLGRVLGPKGLMPSPKAGTVTQDAATAVQEYAAGKLEFRNDAGGNIHAVIGKKSFGTQQLTENAQTLIEHLERIKPSTAKGVYIKSVSVAGTMTPGVRVAL